MTSLGRLNVIRLLVCSILLILPAASRAQQRPAIVEQVAKTYGLDSWGDIEAIRYTFNAEFPGVKVSRSWEWEPKTGRVSYQGKQKDGKPVQASYVQSELASQPANVKDEIQPGFVNDQYWLIFPFHAYWDTSASVQDLGKQKLPIGNGSANHVVVKYPKEAGGYTPGDTWELWVGPDKRVQEFVYRRGGAQKPSVVKATWAGYKKAGPLLISTEHRGTADGKPFHLFFSDVAVRLAGSDKWVNAQ